MRSSSGLKGDVRLAVSAMAVVAVLALAGGCGGGGNSAAQFGLGHKTSRNSSAPSNTRGGGGNGTTTSTTLAPSPGSQQGTNGGSAPTPQLCEALGYAASMVAGFGGSASPGDIANIDQRLNSGAAGTNGPWIQQVAQVEGELATNPNAAEATLNQMGKQWCHMP